MVCSNNAVREPFALVTKKSAVSNFLEIYLLLYLSSLSPPRRPTTALTRSGRPVAPIFCFDALSGALSMICFELHLVELHLCPVHGCINLCCLRLSYRYLLPPAFYQLIQTQ